MDRIISVSTMAFDGHSLETALDELAALGVRYVEPASVDKIFQHLVEEDFCDSRAVWLRNQLSARRLSCLSLSVHMDLTGSDAVERFHRRLEFARNIGARCVNSIAGPAGKLEEFRKNIPAIADRARDLGVMIALENHGDLLDREQQSPGFYPGGQPPCDPGQLRYGERVVLLQGDHQSRGGVGPAGAGRGPCAREDAQDRGRPPALGGAWRGYPRHACARPRVERADARRSRELRTLSPPAVSRLRAPLAHSRDPTPRRAPRDDRTVASGAESRTLVGKFHPWNPEGAAGQPTRPGLTS